MYIQSFETLVSHNTVVHPTPYSGLVEFAVTPTSDTAAHLKSISTHGYSTDLTKSAFDAMLERDNFFYPSFETAELHGEQQERAAIENYIEVYARDKDAFIADLLKTAIRAEQDPEYGDYTHAQSMRQVAAMHFPDIDPV